MANKLDIKLITNEISREFDKNARSLEIYCDKMTSGISGSFPRVGKDTGKLNRSLQLVKTGEFQYKLGFYVDYSYWALKKKGNQMRNLIEDDGIFYQYWKNLFKK